jgi:hypothetical protein
MKVASAVKEFLAAKRQLSPYTRRMYMQRLAVFAAWCKAQGLTLEALTVRLCVNFGILFNEIAQEPLFVNQLEAGH